MPTKKQTPATREFCVYATQVVHQHVRARTAAAAHRIAAKQPHFFEPCDSGDSLRIDPDVKDAQADEFIRVGAKASRCKTCGSELVVTVNESVFNDGECGPCEYRRYRSQPELLRLVQAFRRECSDQIQQYRDALKEDFGAPDDLHRQVDRWKALRNLCHAALANYGQAD